MSEIYVFIHISFGALQLQWLAAGDLQVTLRTPSGIVTQALFVPRPNHLSQVLAGLKEGESTADRIEYVTREGLRRSIPLRDIDARNLVEQHFHLSFLAALGSFKYAEMQVAQGRAADSILALKEGLNFLGAKYQSASVIDDSGQKLVLAESLERKKESEKAHAVYARVLETRLKMYADSRHIQYK